MIIRPYWHELSSLMSRFRPFSIFGRLLASAVVVVGFYLLWLGFMESNALKAIPGGILIPAGLYLMVSSRRTEIRREANAPVDAEGTGEGQE